MRTVLPFNNDWLFAARQLPLDAPDSEFEAITLPHTNKVFSHTNIDNATYQFIATYRKRFVVPAHQQGQTVMLAFDGVMLAAVVFINGHCVTEHLGGYSPLNVDCTPYLHEGENVITLYVDSRERKDVPPYGHLVDYLTFGGVYRDVTLKILPAIFIDDVFVQPQTELTSPQLACDIRLNCFVQGLMLKLRLLDDAGQCLKESTTPVVDVASRINLGEIDAVSLWGLDNPVLYTLEVTLLEKTTLLDRTTTRFGFRQAEFGKDGGFYLNGERIALMGLNRHQTYPYIGAAAPKRLQVMDADILKYELGCNIVRTSHYPQSPHFLTRCDEIGLLVFEEITGWQHIGDDAWQKLVLDELQTMIERDRNHPSIVLWGVRINESADNDDFYTQTNRLAHAIDPTRQTGGVRCFRESHFIEDVFTYNDFSNDVQPANHLPYLITEFSGHMYPTKTWDNEERLIEHALLHARIHNKQMGDEKISGAIGWCAFDYATHMEFGSGDRICYHGVMDTFRLPKWAAYFYQSQQSPSQSVVLKAATRWTMGERSGGGNNSLTVFSNCDEVAVMIGENNLGKFKPDFDTYPHLKHPPFNIHGLNEFSAWGQKEFNDLHLVGYFDGVQVAEQWIASNQIPAKLTLAVDSSTLIADGQDMTRLVFKITDHFDNPLAFAINIVTFSLAGDATLVGENPFPLVGGQAALFIKAGKTPGKVVIHARANGLDACKASIDLLP